MSHHNPDTVQGSSYSAKGREHVACSGIESAQCQACLLRNGIGAGYMAADAMPTMDVYIHIPLADQSCLPSDQFRGSYRSLLGLRTSTCLALIQTFLCASFLDLESAAKPQLKHGCFTFKSTKRTVPGTTSLFTTIVASKASGSK